MDTYWNELLLLCNYPSDSWYDANGFVSLEGRKAAIKAYGLADQLLRWAEEQVRQAGGGDGGETESPVQGYLGLRLDSARRVVTRVGHTGRMDLTDSRLSWGLILRLSGQGDTICSMKSLRAVWEKHGQAANPSVGTVYDAVNELKKRLHDLGVTIESVRHIGYRLRELPTSDRPRE